MSEAIGTNKPANSILVNIMYVYLIRIYLLYLSCFDIPLNIISKLLYVTYYHLLTTF